MLEPIIRELADKISRQKGYHTPYDLFIKPELPFDSKERERIAIIKAGYPPSIFLSGVFIRACVLAEKHQVANIARLRDTVERCLQVLPKMQRTLSMIPIAEAIALRKDSRKWARAKVPGLRTHLADQFLVISNIAVEVTDTLTGTKIVRNGLDYHDLVQQCKHDLSKLIIEDEDMEEWREMIEEVNRVKNIEVKAAEVSVIVGENDTETKVEY